MNPTGLDEHSAACRLLDDYADLAARRGSPVWLLVRSVWDDPLDTCQIPDSGGLLGHVAGPEWDAAAVIGTGRVRLLDQAHEPPAVLVPGLAGGLALSCLVTRQGDVGWRMRLPDGTFYQPVPESGFMLDVLRRALQLPTPPPEASTSALDLAAWVGMLIEAGGEAGRRLDWPEVLARHPLVSDGVLFGSGDQLEALIRDSGTPAGWEPMRRLVAAGLASDVAPPPRLAEWMDDGMFSRWVLRQVPDLDRLLAAARPHLQPAAYRRLRHLARALDDRTGVR